MLFCDTATTLLSKFIALSVCVCLYTYIYISLIKSYANILTIDFGKQNL